VGVWWFSRTPRNELHVYVPESPPLNPDVARWEQTGGRLLGIQLGMARADVESVLGSPEPMNVDAIPKYESTYRTRYLAILKQPFELAPDVRGFCEAELIFDASKPGHPLLKVTCTPRTPPPSRHTVSMAV
jgi:hypothetical protein